MAHSIARFNFTDFVPLPWNSLFHHQNTTVVLERTLVERREEYQIIDRLVTVPDILPLAQITFARAKEMEGLLVRFQTDAAKLQPVCSQSLEESLQVSSILEGTTATWQLFLNIKLICCNFRNHRLLEELRYWWNAIHQHKQSHGRSREPLAVYSVDWC